ncbi:MAG: hypothetical protein H5T50_02230 [Nitrososphaeria archaeon]|nr:hypothetical protein [Nitrososphaeria archaeon]
MFAALKYTTWILEEFFEVCSRKLVLECDKNTRIFIILPDFYLYSGAWFKSGDRV